MRIANLDGRAVLLVGPAGDDGVTPTQAIDIATASDGRFGPEVASIYRDWAAFGDWARGAGLTTGPATSLATSPTTSSATGGATGTVYELDRLGPPVPEPRQVFAIGLNYRDHAREANLEIPTELVVFTKFPSCLVGPQARVSLPSDRVDWEVELVVVLGRESWRVTPEQAWDHIAGLTIGQDLSERRVQFAVKPPQFSLGKSYPGFGPTGPAVVTHDELPDRDALRLGCDLDGQSMQDGTTADLVFGVAEVVSRLSQIVRLLPGDLIFTGTPAGVGSVREPRQYLAAGQHLASWIDGIGRIDTWLT